MDENNMMHFDCEPMGGPEYSQGSDPVQNGSAGGPRKPERKGKITGKIVALLLVVAVLGSVGGSALTAAIAGIHRDKAAEDSAVTGTADEDTPEESQDQADYQLVSHSLPDTLPTNDTGKSLTESEVYALAVNSVVGITTEATTNVFGQQAVAASSGTGFILTEDGYIITNQHVVEGADTIKVTLYSGESYDAELVGGDASYDIAVLKIEAEGLQAVSVGDSDTLQVGEAVVAIGNPLGELTFTMTNGIISALNREINTDGNPQNMIQTNAAINSGNSGGPLFDMDGNVIGVTSAKYSGSTSTGTTIEGLGFAIPINEALRVAYDLVEYGYVKGAYLGISLRDLDSNTASYYSLPVGPRVESVTEGSCAETAGVQVGDIIIGFNGVDVESYNDLAGQLKKVNAGDTVEMVVYRSGEEVTLTVTLDEKPQTTETETETQQPDVQQQPNTQLPDGYTGELPEDFGGMEDFFNYFYR